MEPDATDVEGALAAFLLDMDGLDLSFGLVDTIVKVEDLVVDAQETPSGPASVSDSAIVKRPTKKRMNLRGQILALQHELGALAQQREHLNHEQLLREEIARKASAGICPRAVAHWKQQAQLQHISKQCSQQKQEQLIQRIEFNTRCLASIKTALSEQMSRLLMNSQLRMSDSEGSDGFLYRMLKQSMNVQHTQIEAFLAQCTPASDLSCRYESSIHADGSGIDLRSVAISPFHVEVINEAIQRYTRERLTRVRLDNYAEGEVYSQRILIPQATKKSSERKRHGSHDDIRGHSMFRRIVRGQLIVLVWTTMVDWYDKQTQQSTICKNGWCVIRPSAEHGPSVCCSQFVESTDIYQSDGFSRFPINKDSKRVLNLMDSFSRDQAQIVENLFFDANSEWNNSLRESKSDLAE